MKITPAERILLINQHKILKFLDPDPYQKAYHETQVEIFENGFEVLDYENEPVDPLTEDELDEIYRTLDMFEHLQDSAKALGLLDKDGYSHRLLFSGYDGNDRVEIKYLSFVDFYIEKLERYTDLALTKPSYYNSHQPMLKRYRDMYDRYRGLEAPRSKSLSKEQIDAVLGVD